MSTPGPSSPQRGTRGYHSGPNCPGPAWTPPSLPSLTLRGRQSRAVPRPVLRSGRQRKGTRVLEPRSGPSAPALLSFLRLPGAQGACRGDALEGERLLPGALSDRVPASGPSREGAGPGGGGWSVAAAHRPVLVPGAGHRVGPEVGPAALGAGGTGGGREGGRLAERTGPGRRCRGEGRPRERVALPQAGTTVTGTPAHPKDGRSELGEAAPRARGAGTPTVQVVEQLRPSRGSKPGSQESGCGREFGDGGPAPRCAAAERPPGAGTRQGQLRPSGPSGPRGSSRTPPATSKRLRVAHAGQGRFKAAGAPAAS